MGVAFGHMDVTKKKVEVLGKQMAYAEAGVGDPIVFLHGNPTSSYMWRNVLVHCEGLGRCIVPDLIGMGDSDKLEGGPDRYSLAEHSRYLDALFELLELSHGVTLVMHSWGGVLGTDWAKRHQSAVKGLCFMESPFTQFASWLAVPEHLRAGFQAMRTEMGEKLILEANVMVERGIQSGCKRQLSAAELEEYRRPFVEAGEGRRAMLSFVRAVPVGGEPTDVCAVMDGSRNWLEQTLVQKLFVRGEPGSSVTAEEAALIRSWPAVTEVTVKGKHLLTE